MNEFHSPPMDSTGVDFFGLLTEDQDLDADFFGFAPDAVHESTVRPPNAEDRTPRAVLAFITRVLDIVDPPTRVTTGHFGRATDALPPAATQREAPTPRKATPRDDTPNPRPALDSTDRLI